MGRSRSRAIRGSCRGVTLIELIMTMVIGVVLAAIAVPRLQGIGAVRAEVGAARLIGDLRHARRLALGRQSGVAVQLDVAQERYRVYDFTSGVNVTDPISGDPGVPGQPWSSGLVVDCQTDPQLRGVDLQSNNFGDIVRFDSLGRPANSAGVLFTSAGCVDIEYQGNTHTICVETNTGKIW